MLIFQTIHVMKLIIAFCFFCTAAFTVIAAPTGADYSGYDYVIRLDSTYVDVEETGLGYFHIVQKVEILTAGGALHWRTIKYDYDPLTAAAGFTSVRVIRKGGAVDSINIAGELDYPAPARAIYWGARQKMMNMGRLEPGDIVEYSIFKKGFTYALLAGDGDEQYIPPMRGQFYDIVPFWNTQPVVRKVYCVNLPADKDMQYEFYQGECSVAVQLNGDRRLYRFAKTGMFPVKMEPGRVDFFDCAPKLFMSTAKNWQAKSLWFYKVNEDYNSFGPMPAAQAKVNELLKGAKTEMDKVAVLTHWVADNMRYSGISMGKGEGFTLHSTAMNFTDRCGVCKDKAALLISMLRMAGFEAYPAMTMAGSRIEAIPADHFNHSVAVVKLSDGRYHLLDPTWVPFTRELWSSAEQQQNYLPGVPEGSGLLCTPVSPPENHYVRIHVRSALGTDGRLTGELTVTAEGQSDRTLRSPFTNGFMSDWKAAMERELLAVSPNARMISVDYGRNPKDYTAGPIRITMKYEIPDYAFTGRSGEIVCTPVSVRAFNGVKSYLRLGTQPERRYGFKDGCSRLVELTENITVPAGYRLSGEYTDSSSDNDVAAYSSSVKQTGNTITFANSLALKKRVYDVQDWPAFCKAVMNQKQFADQPLVFLR
jgi:hypothetical protein